jgi:EmrB/QacA subfamily drug resistance transporter
MSTSTTEPVTAPAADADPDGLSHKQIMTILSGLMLGMFLAALDQTIVSTAIRTIGDDLNGLSVQAWVTTAFLITSTISTPLFGKLSDIFGRKPLFMIAITIFVLGSALCGLAQSMYMLAGFRAFQGIGAGGIMPLALAIIGDIIPPRQRARYQGYFMAVFATSSVLGPVIGGFFAGQSSIIGIPGWRWIFYINVPIGVIALLVVQAVLKLDHIARKSRIDWAGAGMLVVGLVPLLIVAEQGRDWGWGSAGAFGCYIVGVLGLIGFVLVEKRMGDAALLPLRLFRSGVFSLGSVQATIVGMGMFGGIAAIPLYLQIVKGASPTKSGLLLLPLVGGIMVASMAAGQVTSRTGRYKIFPILGSVFMIGGLLLLTRVGADTALWQTDVSMAVFGLGLGMNMQSIVLAMQNSVDARDMGVATSSVTFFRQVGGSLGTAIFLSILFSRAGTEVKSAYASAQSTASFKAAAAAHPDQLKQVTSGSSGSLNDTSFLNGLDKTLAHPFLVGFSNAMDLVFLVGACALVVALVVASLMKEVPLRTVSGAQARRAAEEAGSAVPPVVAGPAAMAPAEESDLASTDPGVHGVSEPHEVGSMDRST